MNTLTHAQLETLIRTIKGCTVVSLRVATEPKWKGGKSSPANGVVKYNRVFGLIGFEYEQSVRNLEVKEGLDGTFEALPRVWGKHITRALIEHKGALYLQIKRQGQGTPTYWKNRTRISKSEIEAFLPEHNKANTQSHLEGEVKVNDYKFSSIRSIRILGKTYKVISENPDKIENISEKNENKIIA